MQFTPHQDEVALVRAAQTDAEAFAVLYDRYVQRLYHYCHHRTNNARDAEDLTAQTFLAALEGFPRYRQDGHFAAWLFAIARNKVMDYYRRAPNVPLEEAALPPFQADLAGKAEGNALARARGAIGRRTGADPPALRCGAALRRDRQGASQERRRHKEDVVSPAGALERPDGGRA